MEIKLYFLFLTNPAVEGLSCNQYRLSEEMFAMPIEILTSRMTKPDKSSMKKEQINADAYFNGGITSKDGFF